MFNTNLALIKCLFLVFVGFLGTTAIADSEIDVSGLDDYRLRTIEPRCGSQWTVHGLLESDASCEYVYQVKAVVARAYSLGYRVKTYRLVTAQRLGGRLDFEKLNGSGFESCGVDYGDIDIDPKNPHRVLRMNLVTSTQNATCRRLLAEINTMDDFKIIGLGRGQQ